MGTQAELSEEFIKENHLRLQLSGNVEQLIDHLKTSGDAYEIEEEPTSENDDYFILIKSSKPLDIDHYAQVIEQISHCQLKGINLVKPDLEAIFLAATKRSWEEVRPKDLIN